MKKMLVIRIKKERSNIVNEHQQGRLTVSLLDEAKKNIIRWHQHQAFPEEIKQLKNTDMHKKKQLKKKRKEGRKDLKRSGAFFICLASRAVHIECTYSIDTDSFIQALRRFIAR